MPDPVISLDDETPYAEEFLQSEAFLGIARASVAIHLQAIEAQIETTDRDDTMADLKEERAGLHTLLDLLEHPDDLGCFGIISIKGGRRIQYAYPATLNRDHTAIVWDRNTPPRQIPIQILTLDLLIPKRDYNRIRPQEAPLLPDLTITATAGSYFYNPNTSGLEFSRHPGVTMVLNAIGTADVYGSMHANNLHYMTPEPIGTINNELQVRDILSRFETKSK